MTGAIVTIVIVIVLLGFLSTLSRRAKPTHDYYNTRPGKDRRHTKETGIISPSDYVRKSREKND